LSYPSLRSSARVNDSWEMQAVGSLRNFRLSGRGVPPIAGRKLPAINTLRHMMTCKYVIIKGLRLNISN
jgi:hypothetical protein